MCTAHAWFSFNEARLVEGDAMDVLVGEEVLADHGRLRRRYCSASRTASRSSSAASAWSPSTELTSSSPSKAAATVPVSNPL